MEGEEESPERRGGWRTLTQNQWLLQPSSSPSSKSPPPHPPNLVVQILLQVCSPPPSKSMIKDNLSPSPTGLSSCKYEPYSGRDFSQVSGARTPATLGGVFCSLIVVCSSGQLDGERWKGRWTKRGLFSSETFFYQTLSIGELYPMPPLCPPKCGLHWPTCISMNSEQF